MARSGRTFGDIRTSPRNQRLLAWLRRKPVPHTVVGETADGEERTCVISETGPAMWKDAVSVVRPCVRFEARDKNGGTLRALELAPDDPELQAENELEESERVATSMARHGSVPLISVDIPKLVDSIARNIREASGEAARQQAGAFKDGFDAMTNVVNLCLNLLVRLDDRMAEAEQNANTIPTTAAPVESPRDQMVRMALQRAMGGNGNGAPTGGIDLAGLMQMIQTLQQQQQPPTPEGEEQ